MAVGDVYMICHKVTGRMYIGRSAKVDKRIASHFCALRRGEHPVEDMQQDYNAYGEQYTVSILGKADAEHPKLEIEMMEKYRSTERGTGYNYKDPHVTRKNNKMAVKKKLTARINDLSEDEAEYLYKLACGLFGS